MTTFTATNTAGIITALGSATAGDRIELDPGNYTALSTAASFASPGVVIASKDWENRAQFTSTLDVTIGANWLLFDRLLFGPGKVTVTDADDISFTHCVFEGELDGSNHGVQFGCLITRCLRPIFNNNEMFHWRKCLKYIACDDVVVKFNNIHSMNEDGVDANACFGLNFEDNWLHDRLTDILGSGDFFQTWATDVDRPVKDYTFRGNFFDIGGGRNIQSLFMTNVFAANTPENTDLWYRDIIIEDNVIVNVMFNGIITGLTIGLTVSRNTVLRGFGGVTAPSIGESAAPSPTRVTDDNISNYSQATDFIVQDTDSGAANYYGDEFVDALKTNASLADLRAVADGTIETNGYGAARTRLDMSFVTGPQPPARFAAQTLELFSQIAASAVTAPAGEGAQTLELFMQVSSGVISPSQSDVMQVLDLFTQQAIGLAEGSCSGSRRHVAGRGGRPLCKPN